MQYLKKAEIDKGLRERNRTYLCGDLQQDNISDFIRTDGYEIGITEYKEFVFERPHYHSDNEEFNYVICGSIKVLLINERRELLFNGGDLFVIEKNEPYVCKGLAGTKVIFSKVPGGNDKKVIAVTEAVKQWGRDWDATYEEREGKI